MITKCTVPPLWWRPCFLKWRYKLNEKSFFIIIINHYLFFPHLAKMNAIVGGTMFYALFFSPFTHPDLWTWYYKNRYSVKINWLDFVVRGQKSRSLWPIRQFFVFLFFFSFSFFQMHSLWQISEAAALPINGHTYCRVSASDCCNHNKHFNF